MARLSTIYDKIYDEDTGKTLSAKVFRLRGDEAYAKTTDIAISHNAESHDANGIHLSNFKINLYRTVGSSTVILYDGEDQLGTYTTTSSTSTVNVGTITLSYGDTHKLYAVYKGNSECLSSKSRTETIQINTPDEYSTQISTTGTSTQINTNTNATLTAIVTVNGSETSATHNVDVEVNVDGSYYSTITTGANTNVATGTVTDLEDGKHHITYEVANSDTIFYALSECDVLVGCNVEIMEYPQMFILGDNNEVVVKVTDYNDLSLPMSGQTVEFGNYTATTDSDGIATLTVSAITDGTYSASCNGNSSDEITVVTSGDISDVTISTTPYRTLPDNTWIVDNHVKQLTATIDIPVANYPLAVTGGGLDGTYYTNTNGQLNLNYQGNGDGEVTISVGNGVVSDSITLIDYNTLMYLGTDYNINATVSRGTLNRLNNAYSISSDSGGNIGWSFESLGSTNFEFNMRINSINWNGVNRITVSALSYDLASANIVSSSSSCLLTVRATSDYVEIYVDGTLNQRTSRTSPASSLLLAFSSNLSVEYDMRVNLISVKKIED